MDARVIWDIIGSFATPAEKPVWAKATSEFNYDRQFDQAWLKMLPRLAILAVAENDFVRLAEVEVVPFELIPDAAKAAASGGHIESLEWLIHHLTPERKTGPCHVYTYAWLHTASDTVREWALDQWVCDKNRDSKLLGSSAAETDTSVFNFIQILIHLAFKHGILPTVQYTYGCYKHGDPHGYKQHDEDTINEAYESAYEENRRLFILAVQYKHMHILEWGINIGIVELVDDLIYMAMMNDDLATITLLFQHKCPLPENIMHDAVRKCNLDVLRYLAAQIPGDWAENSEVCTLAVETGDVAKLKWLYVECKCAVDLPQALTSAIDNSDYAMVEYLMSMYDSIDKYKEEFTEDYLLYGTPASRGDIRMAKLLHRYGVPLSSIGVEIDSAAQQNRVEMLTSFHQIGAPLTARAFNLALESFSFQAAEWLSDAGCPCNEETLKLLEQPGTKWLKQRRMHRATATTPSISAVAAVAAATTATATLPVTTCKQ